MVSQPPSLEKVALTRKPFGGLSGLELAFPPLKQDAAKLRSQVDEDSNSA